MRWRSWRDSSGMARSPTMGLSSTWPGVACSPWRPIRRFGVPFKVGGNGGLTGGDVTLAIVPLRFEAGRKSSRQVAFPQHDFAAGLWWVRRDYHQTVEAHHDDSRLRTLAN